MAPDDRCWAHLPAAAQTAAETARPWDDADVRWRQLYLICMKLEKQMVQVKFTTVCEIVVSHVWRMTWFLQIFVFLCQIHIFNEFCKIWNRDPLPYLWDQVHILDENGCYRFAVELSACTCFGETDARICWLFCKHFMFALFVSICGLLNLSGSKVCQRDTYRWAMFISS